MSIVHTNVDLRETNIIGIQTRERLVGAALCPALTHHGIILAGLTEASSAFQFVRHNPQWSQLLACTHGTGRVWIDGQWVSCAAGQVYVTPPHTLHAYQSDPACPWSLCWVQSPADWLCLADRPVLLSADAVPLSGAIAGLHREVLEASDAALLPPWAFLVYSYARRLVQPNGGSGSDPRLRRLWDTVGANLAAPWTVDALAANIGLSGEHLRRLCRAHLGRSPMRQVTALRMRQASALLASESYTIEAVAQLVGYDNPFAFSTAFKRHFGMPPSEYRQGNPKLMANE